MQIFGLPIVQQVGLISCELITLANLLHAFLEEYLPFWLSLRMSVSYIT